MESFAEAFRKIGRTLLTYFSLLGMLACGAVTQGGGVGSGVASEAASEVASETSSGQQTSSESTGVFTISAIRDIGHPDPGKTVDDDGRLAYGPSQVKITPRCRYVATQQVEAQVDGNVIYKLAGTDSPVDVRGIRVHDKELHHFMDFPINEAPGGLRSYSFLVRLNEDLSVTFFYLAEPPTNPGVIVEDEPSQIFFNPISQSLEITVPVEEVPACGERIPAKPTLSDN